MDNPRFLKSKEGGERAPDRLVKAWASPDRYSSTLAIRKIDDGADTAAKATRNAVLILLSAIVAFAVTVTFVVIRLRRRSAST